MPIFKKLPQKRTAYLEQFRDRLHGKDDPAWNDVKEGDFIMQFQGADLKKMKQNKKTKQEELDHDNSYAEDQFRIAGIYWLEPGEEFPIDRLVPDTTVEYIDWDK